MKKLIVATCAILSLPSIMTACHRSENHTTTVASSSDVNGVVTKQAVTMSDYAMRAALGNNPNTAAYVTIKNTGTSDERLVAATCACAAKVSLHSMAMSGGMMVMNEESNGFVIKTGDSLVFAPGGNHIMLENLTVRPKDGDTQAVTLMFEKSRTDYASDAGVEHASAGENGFRDVISGK